jgi:transposase
MGRALTIRTDIGADELRRLARSERDGRAAARMSAIAHALEGTSRAEAARLAGMERQALRDAVLRFNAEGIAGLHDRSHPGPAAKLSHDQQAAVKAWGLEGPDPERDGISTYRLVDIAQHIETAYKVSYSLSALWRRRLGRLGLSWQKARPVHPQADAAARAPFKKTSPRGSPP